MKDKIKINIIGFSGVGKTTIALIINEALGNNGFTNIKLDLGIGDSYKRAITEQDKRIPIISKKIEGIDIEEREAIILKDGIEDDITLKNKSFYLTDKEQAKLEEWQEKIKDLYGEYGRYDYKFSPTGIGNGVRIYSHLAKIELDVTDMDSW